MDVSEAELLIIYTSTLGMRSHQPPGVKTAGEAIKAAAGASALRPDTYGRRRNQEEEQTRQQASDEARPPLKVTGCRAVRVLSCPSFPASADPRPNRRYLARLNEAEASVADEPVKAAVQEKDIRASLGRFSPKRHLVAAFLAATFKQQRAR